MHQRVLKLIKNKRATNQPGLVLLIDPDHYDRRSIEKCMSVVQDSAVEFIFIGGSLLVDKQIADCIHIIKENTDLPVLLFPGSPAQVHEAADALLFLSLISGRNPDFLIGRHVEVAPLLKRSTLEVIPTGYLLVDGGRPTTASYISNTFPLPANKPEVAACTAMAGELLGLQAIYMDCGSGALNPVPAPMISAVKEAVEIPIIVGGGIRSTQQLQISASAGADLIVVGNAIENNPELLYEFSEIVSKD